jgi:hypothetical protein
MIVDGLLDNFFKLAPALGQHTSPLIGKLISQVFLPHLLFNCPEGVLWGLDHERVENLAPCAELRYSSSARQVE